MLSVTSQSDHVSAKRAPGGHWSSSPTWQHVKVKCDIVEVTTATIKDNPRLLIPHPGFSLLHSIIYQNNERFNN